MVWVRPAAVTVVCAVAAAVVYAAMWLGHRQGWMWLHAVDSSSLHALHDVEVKHPWWVRFWDVVCTVFGPPVFRLLGAVAVAAVLVKRKLRVALFLLVSVQFSELVTWAAKGLAQRPRPATALVPASSSSFPSGHALAATVGVLALLTVLFPLLSQRTRVVAAAVGVGRPAFPGLGISCSFTRRAGNSGTRCGLRAVSGSRVRNEFVDDCRTVLST